MGLKIVALDARSGWARAGLHTGDILVAANGHALSSPETTLQAFSEVAPGAPSKVDVLRGEQKVQLSLDLGALAP